MLQAAQVACQSTLTASEQVVCVCVLLLSGLAYLSDHVSLLLLEMSMATPDIMVMTLLVKAPSCVLY